MKRSFRHELKYLVDQHQYRSLQLRWARHLIKDPHTDYNATTPVLSQYFDTPDLRFYRERVEGEYFRNKVRLRTYGTRFVAGARAFLEIKQRLGAQVRKIRQPIEFHGAFLNPETWTFEDPEHSSAFGTLLSRHRLQPSVQTFYFREAYEGVVERDVRVTYDNCLRGFLPRERLTEQLLWQSDRRLSSETMRILEVKCTDRIPRWLAEGAAQVGLNQQAVSKYALGVEALDFTNSHLLNN